MKTNSLSQWGKKYIKTIVLANGARNTRKQIVLANGARNTRWSILYGHKNLHFTGVRDKMSLFKVFRVSVYSKYE